eukprot:1161226-Pelagomonas_calceolata.AAC.16
MANSMILGTLSHHWAVYSHLTTLTHMLYAQMQHVSTMTHQPTPCLAHAPQQLESVPVYQCNH